MKNKKIIGFIVIAVLMIALIVISLFYTHQKQELLKQVHTYFENKETIEAVGDVISKQQEADEVIRAAMNNASYTFDNPCVLVNPYEISPLTALIIFQTADRVEVGLQINGYDMTTMESSTIHAIPVYGLNAGEKNTVVLTQNGQTKSLEIDLSNVSKNNLVVETSNPHATIDQDIYFVASPMGTSAAAYDGNGKIVWYLTPNYSFDMEFLNNGHIYLSNGNVSGIQYTYDGFVEIDLLGKVYRDYSLVNGYHHELISLSDGSILIAGGMESVDSPYSASYVYQINPETGETIRSLDVYDVLSAIDKDFADSLTGTNMINNSIYYNEDTKEMLLSLRGINSIMSVNFETKALNWIFGEEDFYPASFDKYLLHVTDGSRIPHGQHTAYYTSEGYLSVFNNDFDTLDTTNADLTYYQDNYSSATLYQIDGKNISTIWEYDGGKKYFNYALGSFYYEPDGTKLIDFGWTYKESAYVPGNTIYDYLGNTYARVVELDKDDQELFNATIDESIYRAYKHSLYQEKTPNYQLVDYRLIDNNPATNLEHIATESIFEQLDHAVKNPFEFDLTPHSVDINVMFSNSEVVDIYLVSDRSESYIYHYKKANEAVSPKVNLHLDGSYAVYLKINDDFYNTGKVLKFN